MDKTHRSDESSASTAATGSLPHVRLQIVRGQARQKVRIVNSPAFLIGSASDCDLVLGDPQFPQVYAYLIVHAGGVSVRHLGFAPELTVNGRPVTRAALHDGDRLRFGPYEFVIRIQARRAGPDPVGASFGCLPVGTWANIPQESDVDVLSAVGELIGDVRRSLGAAPPAIPLPAAATSRPTSAGNELAAS